MSDIRQSYDAIADEYVRQIYDELQHKPLDRALLDRFANHIREAGQVCDIGTGPGHVARYLHERGVRVCGIDLSPAMIAQARRLNPEIEFRIGDMFALDLPDGSFAGMTSFYSIVNLPRDSIVRALRETHRVLQPHGLLLLAFHRGHETLRKEEMWGIPVSLDFVLFGREEMLGYLREAGFDVREVIERDPYPDVEHPSQRVYIFARKQGATPL